MDFGWLRKARSDGLKVLRLIEAWLRSGQSDVTTFCNARRSSRVQGEPAAKLLHASGCLCVCLFAVSSSSSSVPFRPVFVATNIPG